MAVSSSGRSGMHRRVAAETAREFGGEERERERGVGGGEQDGERTEERRKAENNGK